MKLTLNFVPPRRRFTAALVLLAVAAVIAFVFIVQWYHFHQQSVRLQSQLTQIESAIKAKQRDEKARNEVSPATAARTKEENRILSALRYPWNNVLSSLESSDMTGIALLSLSHEQSSGRTQLSVEAIDIEALTRFIDSLNDGIEQGDRWYVSSYQVQQQANPVTVKAVVISK